MDQPARLPATDADLDAWAVYADHLIAQGDPRGDWIALELAVPATHNSRPLGLFRSRVTPHCARGGPAPIAWTCAHARSLSITQSAGPTHLAHALAVLRSPIGRLLERFAIEDVRGGGREALAHLPPTCTRVALSVHLSTRRDLGELIARLPPHVRELEVLRGEFRGDSRALELISDRFDVLDLTSASVQRDQLAALPAAIARTARVTVQLPFGDRELLALPRCRVGDPDAAVLCTERAACALPRWRHDQLQHAYGLVPARMLFARALVEPHGIVKTSEQLLFRTPHGTAVAWDGRWMHDGHEVRDGEVVTLDGTRATLLAHDTDARIRARFAAAT